MKQQLREHLMEHLQPHKISYFLASLRGTVDVFYRTCSTEVQVVM